MQKVYSFLSTHKDLAFATVEGNRPKIRVFQIMQQHDHTLYFATSRGKEVYRQLQANPHVEMLAMEGNLSVRITGEADFHVTDEMCQTIYRESPILQRLYADYQSLVYFKVVMEQVDYYDLSTTPPLLEHHAL